VVPGVGLWLLMSPAASAGLALPEPTCASDATFGVQIDEEARALGALDQIYVDGAVAVPIRLGLGLSIIQRPADLVERGLVSVDVAGPDGAGLPGHLELALSTQPSPGAGQSGWLIWVGEQPFEPNTNYELEYAFVNEKISMCPEALSITGALPFSTGEGSAKSQLEGVSLDFSSAVLYPQFGSELGCCSAPESKPCVDEGKCTACWTSFYSVGQASAVVNPPLPVSYFAVDISLLAGGVEQRGTGQGAEGYVMFLVNESVPEYCFEARLRPRAPLDAAVSTSTCLPSADVLQPIVTLPFTPLRIADCAEPPPVSLAGPHDVVQAMFGTTELEAQTAIGGITTPPSGPVTPTTSFSDGQRDGCSVSPSSGTASAMPWVVALLLLARRRR
jgi:MYXO-CTERM domain-containing protein